MGPTIIRTDGLYDGRGSVVAAPQFAAVSLAVTGQLVAAVPGSRIRVLAGMLVAAGSVTFEFNDGSGGTALSGVMSMVVGVPIPIPLCWLGQLQTTVGNGLYATLGSSVQVSGWLVYELLGE